MASFPASHTSAVGL